jgi:hypothetical protein
VAAGSRRACPGIRPLNDWLDALEAHAPDPVAAFRNIEAGRFITVRREVRRRTAIGTALVIAGVHDLMHLEQLRGIEAAFR